MYSRRFLNRILKKLSSIQIESIRRQRQICSNKHFSTLAEVRMAKSLNESHIVSRMFYREYMKKNLTESLIQKSREESTNSKTNNKNQDEQSNELNIGTNKETITIIADKYDFCRAICSLPDAPVTSKISLANCSLSKTVALKTCSTKSETSSSPPEKASLSSEKASLSLGKASSSSEKTLLPSEQASVPSGKASLPSEKASSPSEKPSLPSEKASSPSEKSSSPSENASLHSENASSHSQKASTPENESSAIVVVQKTSEAKSNFRERQGERLIDKLTDEEIEEICRTKCPCRRCEALTIKSLNHPFSRPNSGSYSSFYSAAGQSSDVPGLEKQRMSKIRKMRKMRNEGQNRSIRKMIPPANYLNLPQFSGNSRQRIIREAPRIQLKSKYQRKIRSLEKLRRTPVAVRPKISNMLPNRNNSSVSLGYVIIPQMPSNDPLNQNPQALPSHMNSPSNIQERIPLPVTPVPTDPTLNNTEEILLPNIPKDWNISKSNQIKSNDAASQFETTIVEKFVEQGKSDFSLTENRSVMVYGPGKLKLVTSQYPQIRNDEDIIIQMEYVNLTDADAQHYLTGKENPYSFGTATAGRTGTGTVIEIGSDVHNVKPGDKVLIKPISCGKCLLCLRDRSSLCENVPSSLISPHNGTLSHYYVHSSKFITKISDSTKPMNGNVSSIEMYLKNVATTATLSSAIRACQKAKVTAGDNVMVIDGGPLGTATALTAQSMGATSVCLADIRKSILEQALKLGIDRVFLIDPRSPCRNTAIKIWEQIGDYPRLIFDCTGSQLTNQIAICTAKTGGKAILMKNDGNESSVSIANAILRDVDIIISTIGNDESEHAAIQYLNAGRLLLNNNLYHHYDLSTIHEAFQHLLDPNRLKSHIIVECRMNNDAHKEKNDDDETKQ